MNLHGICEDATSWVLTKAEIDDLLANQGYRVFLATVFSTKTVLFLGISADDVATGGRLGWLRSIGIDPGQHFWLTSRRDSSTDRWAENNGIQVIRYPEAAGHEVVIGNFLKTLGSSLPVDDEPPPVVDSFPRRADALPLPEELASELPETIRTVLSSHAAEIFQNIEKQPESEQIKMRQAYEIFYKNYERALFNSWFVSQEPPFNTLFGNRVVEGIGSGAFGTVFRAVSPQGRPIAIKLLRQEIRTEPRMLGSFRRGVKSMRILSDAKVPGMVPYHHAYELPPCVVMDFVEGPNLEVAVQSAMLDRWTDFLRIGRDVARIVRRGHLLPERVLHRDIRPANIMLKGFYETSGTEWDVVVLDFDLSRHRGATELSIVIKGGSALGYLAPEQISEIPGTTTRSTSVDAFGLCMTLYFMFTGDHPAANQTLHTNWTDNLYRMLGRPPYPKWKSLPNRITRLIEAGTKARQSERLDMSQIEAELSQLYDAELSPEQVPLAELWAEELTARAFPDRKYAWDADRFVAKVEIVGGAVIAIQGQEVTGSVELDATLTDHGLQERRSIDRYFAVARDRAAAALRQSGWEVSRAAAAGIRTLSVKAAAQVSQVCKDPNRLARGLAELGRELHF